MNVTPARAAIGRELAQQRLGRLPVPGKGPRRDSYPHNLRLCCKGLTSVVCRRGLTPRGCADRALDQGAVIQADGSQGGGGANSGAIRDDDNAARPHPPPHPPSLGTASPAVLPARPLLGRVHPVCAAAALPNPNAWRLCWSNVRSLILTAVAVLPLTVASTSAWLPGLTEAMPSRCASTTVELTTA
jgi:hypothetical protein